MPIDFPILLAALLSGLVGGVHCIAMCGGVAAGVSVSMQGAPALRSAAVANLGRILGYAAMGAIVGGLGAGLLQLLRIDGLMLAMRMTVGLMMVLIALRVLGIAGRSGFLSRPGAALWRRLAPVQRRLVPARRWPQQLALGMLWGWLPCGLSYSLLTAAWLTASAWHGALLMASFGAGTLATVLPLTWSGARMVGAMNRPGPRRLAAALIATAGLLTFLGPWLIELPAVHAFLEALGCRTLVMGTDA